MKEKKIGIEILRVISMICVVFLHSITQGLRTDIDCVKWDILNILSAFATASVPIFFMISGALILSSEKTYSPKYILKKRIPRLILPLMFWSFIAVVKEYGFIWYYFDIIDVWGAFTSFIKFPQQQVAIHFWFMYYLIPIYLISPVLKVIMDKCPKNIFIYISSIWILIIMLFSIRPIFPEYLQPLLNIGFINNIGFVNMYLGYFVLGYILYKHKFNITNRQLEIIAGICIITISVITAVITHKNREYNEWFKSYKNIFVLILSIAIFLRFIRVERLPKIAEKIILWLSSLSFGIYLMHNIYISALGSLDVPMVSIWEILNVFTQTFFVSIVVIQTLKSIKEFIIKKVQGHS